jgi:hypothetical protein
MKLHILYLLAILLSSIGFYTLGQYVGLYKMQAHAVMLDKLAVHSKRYKFQTKEEQLEDCESRLKRGSLSVLPDYDWYKSHWSFGFPDVADIDKHTESISQQIGTVNTL